MTELNIIVIASIVPLNLTIGHYQFTVTGFAVALPWFVVEEILDRSWSYEIVTRDLKTELILLNLKKN